MNKKGYIALTSILIIMSIVVSLSLAVTTLSIGEIQSSLSSKKSNQAIYILDSCIEDALLTLNETNTLPSSVNLPEGDCTISNISISGSTWSFDVTTSVEDFTKSASLEGERTTTISIDSYSYN